MNPRRKKRLTIIATIIIGLAVVVGLVLYALSQNINLFYSPTEIHNGKKDSGLKAIEGQRIRIGGLVVPGSVHRDNDSLKVSFTLADMRMPIVFNKDDLVVTVKYDGILPDLFREGQGIVANGMLVKDGSISGFLIDASEVLAKHDENYMPKELADSLEETKSDYSQ
jgi:cytochrome c-type biogenesis protein CcmE|tara:strand:- start:232 stop:732 length:501 start_codon:yes stop_codon:yes gene_type:complete